jgi:hypothetical protein
MEPDSWDCDRCQVVPVGSVPIHRSTVTWRARRGRWPGGRAHHQCPRRQCGVHDRCLPAAVRDRALRMSKHDLAAQPIYTTIGMNPSKPTSMRVRRLAVSRLVEETPACRASGSCASQGRHTPPPAASRPAAALSGPPAPEGQSDAVTVGTFTAPSSSHRHQRWPGTRLMTSRSAPPQVGASDGSPLLEVVIAELDDRAGLHGLNAPRLDRYSDSLDARRRASIVH